LKRAAWVLVTLAALLLSSARARAEQRKARPVPAPGYLFVDATFAASNGELAAESVLPRAAGQLYGASVGSTLGVRLKSFGVGARYWLAAYNGGTAVRGVTGELHYRLIDKEKYRFTFGLGAGRAWIDHVDLRRLNLGTYDSSGLAVSLSSLYSWVIDRRVALGAGMRLESVYFERPPLGPCDDAHGCNGVFYPDESAQGGIAFVNIELVATYDL
jgi:hypothetical protein